MFTEKDSAILLLEKAILLSKKTDYQKGIGHSGIALGNIYLGIDKYNLASNYYKEALNAAKIAKSKYGTGASYENLGIVYLEKNEYDTALKYIDSALVKYKEIGNSLAIANIYNDLATIYSKTSNHKKAIDNLSKSAQITHRVNNPEFLAMYYNVSADVYRNLKNYNLSNTYLDSCLDVSKKMKFKLMEQESYKLYSDNLTSLQKFKPAFSFYKKYNQIKDSTLTNNFQNNLAQFEVKYKTAKKEKELIQLREKKLIDKAHNRLLLIILILILSIFSIIIIRIQNKRKKTDILNQQKLAITKKEKEIIEIKLQQKELEETQLKNEIEFKNKQLTNHALNIMQKNKVLQELTEHISKQVPKTDKALRYELIEIRNKLENSLNVDNDWNVFKEYFDQVNNSFFDKLIEVNPKLTRNDYRLCALIKLNMSLKEIASLLNISVDSAKNARYRLKKKLNLKPEQNLDTFIHAL
jgi:hypothetical protein